MKNLFSLMTIAATGMFVLNSCSQDEVVISNTSQGNDEIIFSADINRTSRGTETTTGNLAAQGDTDEHVYITAYYRNPAYDPARPTLSPDNDNYFQAYDADHDWYGAWWVDNFTKTEMERTYSDKIMFWNRAYKKEGNSLVIDENGQQPFHWPGSGQYLTFHAYYPSVEYFSENLLPDDYGGIMDYHKTYKCVFDTYYYTRTNEDFVAAPCLKFVSINPDIDKQKDLVVSKPITDNRATPTPNNANGITPKTTTLEFEHILSQVVIQAKCPSTSEVGKTYEVKVAGVKVSNPRNLATYDLISGEWHDSQLEIEDSDANQQVRDNEYLIRGPHTYRFRTGDNQEDAVVLGDAPLSIMGDSKAIFTIPVERDRSTMKPKNDDHGMYIGVLLRVTRRDNDKVVFPYADEYCYNYEDLDKIEDSDDYFDALQEHYLTYEGPDGERYQWAAIPVTINWEKGKKYVYTLDFSNGVGYNDPEDGPTEDGGIPVLNGKVKVSYTVSDYSHGNTSDSNPDGEDIEFDKYLN